TMQKVKSRFTEISQGKLPTVSWNGTGGSFTEEMIGSRKVTSRTCHTRATHGHGLRHRAKRLKLLRQPGEEKSLLLQVADTARRAARKFCTKSICSSKFSVSVRSSLRISM